MHWLFDGLDRRLVFLKARSQQSVAVFIAGGGAGPSSWGLGLHHQAEEAWSLDNPPKSKPLQHCVIHIC
jgi:hypothetical protein